MKRPWTRGEKALLFSPLLLALGAGLLQWAPSLGRRVFVVPRILATVPGNNLRHVRLSPDGRVLVATGQTDSNKDPADGALFLWDAHTLAPLPGIASPLVRDSTGFWSRNSRDSIAFSPDSQKLAFSSGPFQVWDLKTRRPLWTTAIGSYQADYSPDGKKIAIQSHDKLALLDARSGQVKHNWKIKQSYGKTVLRWSPDGQLLATVNSIQRQENIGPVGGKIELRDATGKKLREIESEFTEAFHFAPDSQSLVSIGEYYVDKKAEYRGGGSSNISHARCFDVSSGRLKWERISEGINYKKRDSYRDVIFSPDGTMVAVHATTQHQILLLEAQTGAEIRRLPMRSAHDTNMMMPHSLAFSLDGKRLFARGRDSIFVWDLE